MVPALIIGPRTHARACEREGEILNLAQSVLELKAVTSRQLFLGEGGFVRFSGSHTRGQAPTEGVTGYIRATD